MTKKIELSYSEAMAEIESILSALQSDNCDVETLTQKVKRASELITLCRKKLRKAETSVEKLFE
ncbi:MAG: exodeoxyribonuclease VII small subunit [Alistipes sp.]|nr:exodeoxyribonuclease VII small subunit [Alistipes sp.]